MREKWIDFQKLVPSIIQQEEEEEEKRVLPRTHAHICIYMRTLNANTRENVLIVYFLSQRKENLIKVHGAEINAPCDAS